MAIQLNDSSRFIETVCKLMDGTKELFELKEDLEPVYPKETLYLEKLLEVLDRECLLEDKAKNYPSELSNYELQRWARNIDFFGSYTNASDNKFAYQEKLKSTKVAIFGLGGVGYNILLNLAAMGVDSIKAVDFDKVELSNLNRQIIYSESHIGKLKSIAAKERINEFLPNSNIEFVNKKINSAEDIEEIIKDQDIVIASIDQPRDEVIDWFNLACIRHRIPFICGSLDSRLVTYFTIIPDKTGCVECWKNSSGKTRFMFQDLIKRKDFVASSPQTLQ